MSTTFDAARISAHLRSTISHCEQFLTLLKLEESALHNRDTDAIESLLEEKLPLIDALEHAAQVQKTWVQEIGNEEDLQARLEREIGPDFVTLWRRAKELYQATRAQNEINGRLLSKQNRSISHVLDVMRGRTATPSLYTSAGAARAYANTSKVGEA